MVRHLSGSVPDEQDFYKRLLERSSGLPPPEKSKGANGQSARLHPHD